MKRKKRHWKPRATAQPASKQQPTAPPAAAPPEPPFSEPAGNEVTRQNVDPPSENLERTRPLRYRLWLHPEVPLQLRDKPPLFQRLGLLIEQLAARGHTSVVKGCQGENRGWRRSPLGGTHGQQYYLWWAPAGSRPTAGTDLDAGGIAIRAARHHDDLTALGSGNKADYIEIGNADRIAPDIAGSPWTQAQQRFEQGSEAVRVLEGSPGSGKTTALWHSIDARADEHVLYVTWSGTLAEEAAAHFESFSAPSVRTTCIDFATLLAWITEETVAQQALQTSEAAFERAVKLAKPRKRGEWEHIEGALYAEVRAVLLGSAWVEGNGTVRQDGCLRLDEQAYGSALARLRRNDEVNRRAVVGTVKDLAAGSLNRIFPELAAAAAALDKLRQGKVPGKFADVDRIAVDEAQDLTLTELAVIVELARTIEKVRGRRPIVVIAGDEGQTVRPSGFTWARTREMLAKQLSKPATYAVDTQLRCPKRIDDVCTAIRGYYRGIEKAARPAGQHDAGVTEGREGRVIRISVGANEKKRFIKDLNNIAGAAMITATRQVPEWVPEELRNAVLTPAQAKGLEYQTVAIVGMGAGASAALARTGTANNNRTLNHEGRRAAIDRMRVALSRTTETLAVVSVEGEAECNDLIKAAAIPYGVDDLLEELRAEAEGKTPDERAMTLSEECRQLRDRNLPRALMRARQALELLGESDEGGRTADAAITVHVTETVLGMLTQGWLSKAWTPEEQADATVAGIDALEHRERIHSKNTSRGENREQLNIESELLEGIASWGQGEKNQAVGIADRLGLLVDPGEQHWSSGALQRYLPALRADIRAGAGTEAGLAYRAPRVERWLRTLGSGEEARAEAEEITTTAFDNAMSVFESKETTNEAYRPLRAAQEMLATTAPDATRDGRMEEALGRYETAAECYRRGGAKGRLRTMARKHALWEIAVDVLEGEEREVVQWLDRIAKFASEIPDGLGKKMTIGESIRLRKEILVVMLKKLRPPGAEND